MWHLTNYGTSKCTNIEGENDEATAKASQQESCELSKPCKSSQTSIEKSPWFSRLREKYGSSNVSYGNAKTWTRSSKGKEKVNHP